MVMPAPATLEYAPPKLIAEALRAGREPGVKEVRRLLERHGLLEAVTEGAATPEQIRALLSLPETKALPKVGRAVLLAQLGFALGIAGRYEETLATYSRATDLDPDFGAAWFNKGVTLGRLERPTDEIAVYDQVVARFGAAPEPALQEQVARALVNKGIALFELGDAAEALASFENAYGRRLHLPEKGAALFSAAAVACVVLGVSGIKQRWLPDLETGTRAYIKWRGRARRDK